MIIGFLDILAKFIHTCPNLETLHIGYKEISIDVAYAGLRERWDANFLKMIRFDRLTYLTFNAIDLCDGDFFEDVKILNIDFYIFVNK